MKNLIKNEKELQQLLEKARAESTERFQNAPMDMDFDEYNSYMSEVNSKVSEASRKYRLVKSDYVMSQIPEYGDKMTLKDFIENVEGGGFIDYDGSGNYATADKESDIGIYSSDVKANMIRDDFEYVIWYNR